MNQARILAHEGKHGVTYWLIDNREQVNAAMKLLFDKLDSEGCYHDWINPDQQWDLEAARSGEHSAIYRILKARQDYEYEKWEVIYAIDPCAK
jgi:hypothetical protein